MITKEEIEAILKREDVDTKLKIALKNKQKTLSKNKDVKK
jgi:hypothetical protein